MNYSIPFALMLAGSTLSAHAKTQPLTFESHDVKQRYIVTFKQNAFKQGTHTDNTFNALNASNHVTSQGGNVIKTLPNIRGVAAMLSRDEVNALTEDNNVALVEADPQRFLAHKGLYTYGVEMIQAPLVSDSASSNQSVCIIDSGYDRAHEDLPDGPNITGKVINELTETVDIGEWYEDSYGHGSHVAGTIAAMGNNLGFEGILHRVC